MNKYIDCKDCQKQYDCDHTFMGGCFDGQEYEGTNENKHDFTGMFINVEKIEPLPDTDMKQVGEEKKLTDEEIVKAIEICANWNNMSNCKDCPIGLDACCENQNGFAKYALELIRRLQADNKTLTDINNSLAESKKRLEMGQRVPELEKAIADLQTKLNAKEVECTKQKEEIERMTEENNYQIKRALVAEGRVEKLSRENVELRKKVEEQRKIIEYQDSVEDKNAELQKQVDELKEELDKAYEAERANIRAEIADAGTSCHWCERQTVEDTAKEVYCEINSYIKQGKEYCGLDWRGLLTARDLILLWCRKKGVEVE